jgi:MFS transporter, SET family, sugar efflux transporter
VRPLRLYSTLAVVWRKSEYRRFFLLMLLSSVGLSSTSPLIALHLVEHLHVSLSVVGLFFVCQALPGFGIGLMIGRQSDRWRSRVPVLWIASVWTAVGWVIFAFSSSIVLDFVDCVLFLSVSGATIGQTFAALHDVMVRDGEEQPALINSTVRSGWSFGFVFGPVVGTMLAAHVSFRLAFLIPACLSLLTLVLLRGLDVPVVAHRPAGNSSGGVLSSTLPLYVFTAISVLVLSGTGIKNSYLPIDVTQHLHGTVGLYGTIVAISPVVELVAMPLAGLLSLKYPLAWLVAIGLVVATVEYFLLAASTALWQIYAMQAMDAWVVAVIGGLGLTYAQRLAPDRAGLVSGTVGSSYGIGTVVGNLIGSAAVPIVGVPHVFYIPGALCGVSLLTFIGLERSRREKSLRHLPASIP